MSDFKDFLSKYIETKNKLKELEKKTEKYNKMIQEYMTKENMNYLIHEHDNQKYKFKKSIVSRDTISKKDLPLDIWDKYSKSSSYVMLHLSKMKD
jgi:hypothetical protein